MLGAPETLPPFFFLLHLPKLSSFNRTEPLGHLVSSSPPTSASKRKLSPAAAVTPGGGRRPTAPEAASGAARGALPRGRGPLASCARAPRRARARPPQAETRRAKRAAAALRRHFGVGVGAEAQAVSAVAVARCGGIAQCRGVPEEGRGRRGTEKGGFSLRSQSRKGGAALAPAAGPEPRMRAESGRPRRRDSEARGPGGLM